ncbi:MAG: class I SAM-dependent DNA methyltransferase [Solirubrobacteraceae bacterium]
MSRTTPSGALDFSLRFPQREEEAVEQDEESVDVTVDGETRRMRFHDYAEIYAIPGLYERLFYEELKCQSPKVVCETLGGVLRQRDQPPEDLRVLDVGAGNGMVSERLRAIGVGAAVGIDIIPEAAEAAERDRPGVYDEYLVADLTDLDADEDAALAGHDFNALVTVAALGFGDIPPEAFAVAFDHVADGGLVALTIKEDFLSHGDGSGFSRLVQDAVADGALEVTARRRYRHRLSVTGEELHYVAVVGVKQRDL